MSDQRPDDETLGRALGRAVETQSVRETPFERSRLAHRIDRPARGGWLGTLAAAAAVALFIGMAAFIVTRGPQGVAELAPPTSATPAVPATSGPPVETAAPVAASCAPELTRVFFARDQLPPVAGMVRGSCGGRQGVVDQIGNRLSALLGARPEDVPAGAFTATGRAPTGGRQSVTSTSMTVEGDLATVEIGVDPSWAARGAAQSRALVQQLVYTITDVPGIRRARLKDPGKQTFTIDQLVIDKPLSREDVLPYEFAGSREPVVVEGDARPASNGWAVTDTVARGVTRLTIQLRATTPTPAGSWSPKLSAQLRPNPDERALPGKWLLELSLPGTRDPRGEPASTTSFAGSPLRAVRVSTTSSGTTYVLGLDDARPWRLSLAPVQSAPAPPEPTMRLNVDLGGHGQAISDSVAVYEPEADATFGGGPVERTVRISGVARAFEANVSWRFKDSAGRIVGSGFTTASVGTSPVWGTFQTKHTLPEGLKGSILLEVFWTSPRDGGDTGLVSIPLQIR